MNVIIETIKNSKGSVVVVKSGNVIIDSFQTPKFSGEKYCKSTNGMFAARYKNAVAKAVSIFENQQVVAI